MNEAKTIQKAYDIVIRMDEPRYWYFLLGSFLAGFVVVQAFQKLRGERKERALRNMGIFMVCVNLVLPLYGMLHPDVDLSLHRNLPVHFCGINGLLVAFNCFWKNQKIFTFSAFLGTIGGLHALLTPQLTIGDAPVILTHYYFNHSAIIVIPIIMARAYGFRFPKWGWVWTYAAAAVLSTAVGGFNWYLNTFHPADVTANYMYMWEAPKVDNPFVQDMAWPWYILPLHAGLVLHLVVINFCYRWGTPMAALAEKSLWLRRFS
ncbi:MAG: hypothetical protein CL845_05705 [Crocinitomicaceae bacterium]|nr:hypothetical protein [Crocinitomicaceae bacterium]